MVRTAVLALTPPGRKKVTLAKLESHILCTIDLFPMQCLCLAPLYADRFCMGIRPLEASLPVGMHTLHHLGV